MTRLLTAREVAELVGVSTETVLRWTRAGSSRRFGSRPAPFGFARRSSMRG
jgi:predicted DNA-binding transcriptional regulator AlpA